MINKKGSMILRDVIFMLLIGTSIIIFASVFVNEMSTSYNNSAMGTEFAGRSIKIQAEESFGVTKENMTDAAEEVQGGLGALVTGALDTARFVLSTVFLAPVTFSNMIEETLIELGVSITLSNALGILVMVTLYTLIVFVIISAFLQGGKL